MSTYYVPASVISEHSSCHPCPHSIQHNCLVNFCRVNGGDRTWVLVITEVSCQLPITLILWPRPGSQTHTYFPPISPVPGGKDSSQEELKSYLVYIVNLESQLHLLLNCRTWEPWRGSGGYVIYQLRCTGRRMWRRSYNPSGAEPGLVARAPDWVVLRCLHRTNFSGLRLWKTSSSCVSQGSQNWGQGFLALESPS